MCCFSIVVSFCIVTGCVGTGKTLTARIIAQQSERPMVHVSVENIASKWYGDSEKRIAQVRTFVDIHT